MPITYPHIEDYLEYLGGYEVGLAVWQPHSVNRISLARYDIAIVNSMASTTVFGTALTDKQAELAVKLVLKYRRQFAKLNIDVAPVETPTFRLPLIPSPPVTIIAPVISLTDCITLDTYKLPTVTGPLR